MDSDIEPVISESRMRVTAIIIASALFMQSLDSTIIATALPAMAHSFHIPPLHMSVALTSYLISLSIFIPASGWVADRFGARQVFRSAIVVFTIGSIFCGFAPSLSVLVVARVFQGLGGAMMVPVGRLVLMRSISHSQMVSAMAWLTMPALLGPVIGPPLGGFIVSYTDWRWIFDINVPVGIIGVIAVTRFIPDVREEGRGGKLDARGLILSGLAMALLMAGFETTGRDLVPLDWTLSAYAAGLAACALYWWHAKHHPNPVLDFSLLALPTFAIPILAGSLFRIAVGALPFLLPLMLQLNFGFTPLASGLVTFASAAGAILMKPAAPPLLARFGFRNVLIWNGTLAALAMSLCAAFEPSWPSLVMSLILFAGGFSPLPAIHRLYRHRLWRYSALAHVRRHQLLVHHPATLPHPRHRRRCRHTRPLNHPPAPPRCHQTRLRHRLHHRQLHSPPRQPLLHPAPPERRRSHERAS